MADIDQEKVKQPEAPVRLPQVDPRAPEDRVGEPPISAEQIQRLIEETAYFKAQARNFAVGGALQDWLDAEEEVRRRMQSS